MKMRTPSGMSLMVTDSDSVSSVNSALMSSLMAVSSRPETAPTSWSPTVPESRSSLGASAVPSPAMVILTVPGTDISSPPSSSVVVAVTLNAKVPVVKPSGEFNVRLARSAWVRVQTPVSGSTVPADSEAPSGTPVMVMESTSEPSTSVRLAEMSSAMEVSPELPPVGLRVRSAGSAMPLTSTSMKPRPVSLPSASSSVIVSEKSTSESLGGVMARPAATKAGDSE